MMRTLPLGHGVPVDREGTVFVRTELEGGTVMVAFDEVVERITDAARQVEADGGASPVLVAVLREFQAKLAKAERQATGRYPVATP